MLNLGNLERVCDASSLVVSRRNQPGRSSTYDTDVLEPPGTGCRVGIFEIEAIADDGSKPFLREEHGFPIALANDLEPSGLVKSIWFG
jgi:hypothetical protein